MTWVYPLSLAIISACVMSLERFFPWRPNQKQLRRGFISDLAHLVFNGHFLGLILSGLAAKQILPRLDALLGPEPMRAIARNAAADWPIWLQIPVALLVLDFVQWCVHNLLHRVPFLWQFHKTHHSVIDGEMDWIVSFRFQWVEVVVYKSMQYLPLAFFGFGGEALLFHAIFGTLIGHLNHSNLDLGHGKWTYLLNSPRMHIWHHDVRGDAKTTVNFGIIFSVWDWIFRTAKMKAASDEELMPQLGFAGVERFPRDFVGHTAWPLPRPFGVAVLALGFWANAQDGPRPSEMPMFGERTASSQPNRGGTDGFEYARTPQDADQALEHFGEEAALLGFAHPEDSVSIDELARALGSPRLVILDVRPMSRFEEGHVPSALQVFRSDYAEEEPIPGLSKPPAEIESLLRSRGVRATSIVVLYGDGGPEPYRLWWTLLAIGGYPARVLDGGLIAWKGTGRAIAEGSPRDVSAGDVKLSPPRAPPLLWSEIAPKRSDAQLVDTRSPAEYLGAIEHPEAARAGRIPGSVHMEWLEILRGPEDPRLKSPDQLKQAFVSHHIDLERPVITVCQSGTRSSATYFALRQLGLPSDRITNYNGSWAEYSRLDLPIEVSAPR
jgi:3-mercaptopyruvate sulfurtransferase SseA/sterol desaturase/sphingolipid hydroxylase (fatty acid hydroxylase superfamily)